jgi:ribosomal protein S27E
MANSIIDDTTAIGKRLRAITGETTKTKVVKIDCIHCRDVGWVRSSPSSRWRECLACGTWKHNPSRPD